jgi:hypothetical protein
MTAGPMKILAGRERRELSALTEKLLMAPSSRSTRTPFETASPKVRYTTMGRLQRREGQLNSDPIALRYAFQAS